jgi:CDP-glucose 4,6-dehydratase
MESMDINPSWWHGRRVLVTGHTGFKGAWLCLLLEALGARVWGYALESPTKVNLFDLAGIAGRMQSIHGDVRDLPALKAAFDRADPEVLIHMAAQSLVRASYVSPVETFNTNVMGTVHVLEAARGCKNLRALVNVTTDKCYENKEWAWGYRENEPMGGHDPYSASKGCAELVTAAYRASFFAEGAQGKQVPSIGSARAGNVIGGGDWAADRLLPDCMRALGAGQAIGVRNPRSTRPWQFVLEPLVGYLLLAQRMSEQPKAFSQGWNFGPAEEDAKPVGWIVQAVVDRWGAGARWEQIGVPPGADVHEAHYLKLDCSKARSELGWRPRMNLALGLDWTVEWFKAYFAGGDARAISMKQIDRFLLMKS